MRVRFLPTVPIGAFITRSFSVARPHCRPPFRGWDPTLSDLGPLNRGTCRDAGSCFRRPQGPAFRAKRQAHEASVQPGWQRRGHPLLRGGVRGAADAASEADALSAHLVPSDHRRQACWHGPLTPTTAGGEPPPARGQLYVTTLRKHCSLHPPLRFSVASRVLH